MVGARGRRGTQQTEKPKFFFKYLVSYAFIGNKIKLSKTIIQCKSTRTKSRSGEYRTIYVHPNPSPTIFMHLEVPWTFYSGGEIHIFFWICGNLPKFHELTQIQTCLCHFFKFLNRYIEPWHLPRVFFVFSLFQYTASYMSETPVQYWFPTILWDNKGWRAISSWLAN